MNIGIYSFDDYDPTQGGGFTFVNTILNAFLLEAKYSSHQFVIFCTSSAEKALKPKISSSSNVRLAIVPKKSRLNSTIVTFKSFFPILIPILNRFNSIEKAGRKHKIDLVWFVGGWIHDTLDIPYVATVWDLQHRTHPWFPEVSEKGRWEYRERLFSGFLQRASHVITGTHVGKEQLGWFYQIPEDQISIIPHPVPEINSESEKKNASAMFDNTDFLKKPFFLYPAQFWGHKNHVNLVYALKELKDQNGLDVNLVFTGSDKGNLAHVTSVAAQLQVEKSIFYLGFVSQEQLVFLYKNALALTYLSFSGPENLPPLEAFSLNCPVINSDFPGAKEQLGEAALYVNPRAPKDIASQMTNVIQDSAIRTKLIDKGKTILKEKSPDKFIKKIFTVFDNFESIRRTWR